MNRKVYTDMVATLERDLKTLQEEELMAESAAETAAHFHRLIKGRRQATERALDQLLTLLSDTHSEVPL